MLIDTTSYSFSDAIISRHSVRHQGVRLVAKITQCIVDAVIAHQQLSTCCHFDAFRERRAYTTATSVSEAADDWHRLCRRPATSDRPANQQAHTHRKRNQQQNVAATALPLYDRRTDGSARRPRTQLCPQPLSPNPFGSRMEGGWMDVADVVDVEVVVLVVVVVVRYRMSLTVAFRIAHTCLAADDSGMCTCCRPTAFGARTAAACTAAAAADAAAMPTDAMRTLLLRRRHRSIGGMVGRCSTTMMATPAAATMDSMKMLMVMMMEVAPFGSRPSDWSPAGWSLRRRTLPTAVSMLNVVVRTVEWAATIGCCAMAAGWTAEAVVADDRPDGWAIGR